MRTYVRRFKKKVTLPSVISYSKTVVFLMISQAVNGFAVRSLLAAILYRIKVAVQDARVHHHKLFRCFCSISLV